MHFCCNPEQQSFISASDRRVHLPEMLSGAGSTGWVTPPPGAQHASLQKLEDLHGSATVVLLYEQHHLRKACYWLLVYHQTIPSDYQHGAAPATGTDKRALSESLTSMQKSNILYTLLTQQGACRAAILLSRSYSTTMLLCTFTCSRTSLLSGLIDRDSSLAGYDIAA